MCCQSCTIYNFGRKTQIRFCISNSTRISWAFTVSAMDVGLEQNNQKLLRGGGITGDAGRLSEMHRFEDIDDMTTSQEIQNGRIRDGVDSLGKIGISAIEQKWRFGYSISSNVESTAHSEPSSPSSSMYIELNEPTSFKTNPALYTNRRVQEQAEIHSIKDVVIASILIVLIVILMINFVFLIYEPTVRFCRRFFGRLANENQTLVERRYKTIDKWLIQKVNFVKFHVCFDLTSRLWCILTFSTLIHSQ